LTFGCESLARNSIYLDFRSKTSLATIGGAFVTLALLATPSFLNTTDATKRVGNLLFCFLAHGFVTVSWSTQIVDLSLRYRKRSTTSR
jgi:hypothetical protein